MFGKKKWLAVIALAMLCMACDLEGGNQGGGTTPAAPTNVRAVANSPTSINVSWDTVTGATEYEVYYEFGSTPISRFTTVKVTSCTHDGLQPNTIYHYYVRAKNKAGTSDSSSRASATTQSR